MLSPGKGRAIGAPAVEFGIFILEDFGKNHWGRQHYLNPRDCGSSAVSRKHALPCP